MTRTDLAGLFAYDAWANRETLASVTPVAAAIPKAVVLVAHIAGAKALWLARIRSAPAPLPVWPTLSPAECAAALAQAAAGWEEYLRSDATDVTQEIAYTNSKGEAFRNRVADIATHVVFHSHYHRGQIATFVRAAGQTPAYTDFIHAVRTHATGTQEVHP